MLLASAGIINAVFDLLSGWIGLIVLVLSCIAIGWCGVLLGKCWLMLEERFPEYQDHCRDPYPSIGYEAFGKPGKYVYLLFTIYRPLCLLASYYK